MRFISLLLFCFCISIANAKSSDVIGVSIMPQKYFVERIAGNTFDVVVMVDTGYNPVTYEPKPKQLTRLGKASMYFLSGVPFEKKWVEVFKRNNPHMTLVSLNKNIKLRQFSETGVSHSHDDSSQHTAVDPHFWMSPALVKVAAKTILDTLIEHDPAKQSVFLENYQSFIADLSELDAFIRSNLSGIKHREFAVFHPSWGYFADEYGLRQIAIEVQNRQSGARTLNNTINVIRDLGIKVIFVQKQFSETDAGMIARETGARLVQVDPLAENYIENMRSVSRLFSEALQ